MKLPSLSTPLLGIIFFRERGAFTSACNSQDHDHHDHHHRIVPQDHRAIAGVDEIPFPDCGAESPSKEQRLAAGLIMDHFHSRRDSGARNQYEIPVHFHVVRNDDGSGDVSDNMLNQYMDGLNDAYEGSSFSFKKHSIERIDSSTWHLIDSSNYWDLAYAHHKGGIGDMNIYFADIQIAAGGWAYLPHGGTAGSYWDGIVLESNYIKYGLSSSYVRDSVLPHEAGHW